MKRFAYLIAAISIATLFLYSTLVYGRSTSTPTNTQFIWPISGTTTPDLPQSSAYGPRLKAGSNFRYDYHQGIDIPTPVSTTLLAVSTGTVRIAGSHPLYQDGVVQLNHGNGLYSNYLHISASLVITNQIVNIGDPVALSGISESGFPHLHFEIRDGSLFRKDTINPLRYLPYPDHISHTIAITSIVPTQTVHVQVTTPAVELDVNQITLTVYRLGSNELLVSRVLDYEARNLFYDGDPTILDNPDLDNVIISPHQFVTVSNLYVIDFQFYNLGVTGDVRVAACAIDLQNNSVCVEEVEDFGGNWVYLPFVTQ